MPPGVPRSLSVLGLAIAMLAVSAPPAAAAGSVEDRWLAGLTERIVADLAAGKPLVVEVHAPLCDNTIIQCGNAKLGDGDNPDTNLYWSTTPGLGSWFARRDGGWTRVARQREGQTGDDDILAVHAYRRMVAAPAAWRAAGAPAKFELDIVIHGWRGKAIDRALSAYAADAAGGEARTIALGDGTAITAGGAAQIIAWVGHNRLMDLERFDWPGPAATAKGILAIACSTAPYMQQLSAATRVPLLMTRDLMFANAAPLEAAVLAYVAGGGFAQIRHDATAAYAEIQRSTFQRVSGLFSNPADTRWPRSKAPPSQRAPRSAAPEAQR
jgi:hypothetical protein